MKDNTNPIQVADRIFLTIETIASTGPIGLIELSRELNLNKSTLHRILNSLIYMGYVKQDRETAKYSLSLKIWDIANQVLSKMNIIDIAKPHLKHLVEVSNETVHLVQIDGTNAVYIDKVESYSNSVRLVSRIGKRIPLYCSGVGKALLADMDDAAIHTIWKQSKREKLTEHTILSWDAFMKTIVQIRKNGYALDNEENELGVRCIAADIKDYSGNPKYAFSISAPITRMNDTKIAELSAYVLETKKRLAREWQP